LDNSQLGEAVIADPLVGQSRAQVLQGGRGFAQLGHIGENDMELGRPLG
jgi:hypothetical protein